MMNGNKTMIASIENYFINAQVNQNTINHVLDVGLKEAKKGNQSGFINNLFSIMQQRFTKENMKMFIKRFLHIINQLLIHDEDKQQFLQYKTIVSRKIVDYFISLLTHIFKNNLNDLILDLKQYRKKWAKRITDEAFDQLKETAFQKFRFDVDKGIPEEVLLKIKKNYEKRKFNEGDFQKYLGSKPTIDKQQQRKPRKKVKIDSESEEEPEPSNKEDARDGGNVKPSPNDMIPPHSSYFPSQTSHNYPSNPYYFQYPPNQHVNSNYYYPRAHYPQQQQPNYNGYLPQNNYAYQDPRYPVPHQPYTNENQSYSHEKRQRKKQFLKLIQGLKSSSIFQCRNCGIKLLSQEKHNEHCEKHFNEAQKAFQLSHSRRDHLRKQKMPTIQEWIEGDHERKMQEFIVPVRSVPSYIKECFVCQDKLESNWSDRLDEWVFIEAVKTRNADEDRLRVCHYECFKTFEENQRYL